MPGVNDKILAALDELEPQEQDDQILRALDELEPVTAAEPPGPQDRPGSRGVTGSFAEPEPQHPYAVLGSRLPAVGVGAAAGLVQSIYDLASYPGRLGQKAGHKIEQRMFGPDVPGQDVPSMDFRKNFINIGMQHGLINEADELDLTAERFGWRTGQGLAMFAPGLGALKAMQVEKAARATSLLSRIFTANNMKHFAANAGSLGYFTAATMQSNADREGIELSPNDVARQVAASGSLALAGTLGTSAVLAGVNKIAGLEIGRLARGVLTNAATNTLFTTIWPEAGETRADAALSGFASGLLANGIATAFPGKAAPKSKKQVEESVPAVTKFLDEANIGVANSPKRGVTEAEIALRLNYARNYFKNTIVENQIAKLDAPGTTAPTRPTLNDVMEKVPGLSREEALRVTREMERFFGGKEHAAERREIARTIVAEKQIEMARQAGGEAAADYARYKSGYMSPFDRALYEKNFLRATPPADVESAALWRETHRNEIQKLEKAVPKYQVARAQVARDRIAEIQAEMDVQTGRTKPPTNIFPEEQPYQPPRYERELREMEQEIGRRKQGEVEQAERMSLGFARVRQAEGVRRGELAERDVIAMERELAGEPPPPGAETRVEPGLTKTSVSRQRPPTSPEAEGQLAPKAKPAEIRRLQEQARTGGLVQFGEKRPSPNVRALAEEALVRQWLETGTTEPQEPQATPAPPRVAPDAPEAAVIEQAKGAPHPREIAATVQRALGPRLQRVLSQPQALAGAQETARRIRVAGAMGEAARRAQESQKEAQRIAAMTPKQRASRLRAIEAIEEGIAKTGKTYRAIQALKPKPRPGEKGDFWPKLAIAGAALGVAGVASQALATPRRYQDDESKLVGLIAAGGLLAGAGLGATYLTAQMIATMRKTGRPISMRDRWRLADAAKHSAQEVERINREIDTTEAIRKITRSAERFIYTGKNVNPREFTDAALEITDGLADLAARKQTLDLSRNDIARAVGGPVTTMMAQQGPAGEMGSRLLEDVRMATNMAQGKFEAWHNAIDPGPYDDPHPGVPLHGKEKDFVNEYVDWRRDPSLPRPDIEAWEKKPLHRVWRRIGIAELREYGRQPTGSPEMQAAIRRGAEAYDGNYREAAGAATDYITVFSALQPTEGTGYAPAIFRQDFFEPPWQERIKLGSEEFYKRVERARANQEAIARETGIELSVIQQIAHEMVTRGYRPAFQMPAQEIINATKSTFLDYEKVLETNLAREHDPALQADIYMRSFIRRIEAAKRFGPRFEIAEALAKAVEKDGYSKDVFYNLLDIGLESNTKRMQGFDGMYWKIMREVNAGLVMAPLATLQIKQIPQLFTPSYRVGVERVARSWPAAFRGTVALSSVLPESVKRRFGDKHIGRIAQEMGVAQASLHLQHFGEIKGFLPRILAGVIKFTLGGFADRWPRVMTSIIGPGAFRVHQDLLDVARKRGDTKAVADEIKIVREFFRDPVHKDLATRPLESLEPLEQEHLEKMAGAILSDRYNGQAVGATMPMAYSAPITRPLFSLMSFMYRNSIEAKDLAKTFYEGGKQQRLRMLGAFGFSTIGGVATIALMNMIRRMPDEQAKEYEAYDFFVDAVIAQGTMGLWTDVGRNLSANPVRGLAGSFYSQAWDFGEAYQTSAREKKPDALVRFLARRIPAVREIESHLPRERGQKRTIDDIILRQSKRPQRPERAPRR